MGNSLGTIKITNPDLYGVNVDGKEKYIVPLFEIINLCNKNYDNPAIESARKTLIKESPAALNFIMEIRKEYVDINHHPYTYYKIIGLSKFHKHICPYSPLANLNDYIGIISNFSIDKNEVKCLLTFKQLKLFNFIKDNSN